MITSATDPNAPHTRPCPTDLKDSQIEGIVSRADVDDNEVIDFEEFCKSTPATLRTNLIKLAKANGDDLGFLI